MMSNVETRVHSFIHKYYNLYSLWRNMASLLTIYYDNYTMVLARVVFFLLSKLLFFFSRFRALITTLVADCMLAAIGLSG